ncbi:calcium/sodium antiporter [Lentilitoribacter sp. EG35]|uniref:calcium/sodium antiporter n=1 Tax=Lentilitoribacter sp. EG35 TaxID=3234192 RepID=UPI0034605774
MYDFLILATGLVVLVFAGDYLVRGAVSLAEQLGISPTIIGLTIVAFGTSAPELFVSVQAALDEAPGIALGNIIGSNTANILLVLGAPAIIAPLAITSKGLRSSLAYMMGLTFTLIWFMHTDARITQLEGLILFVILITYLIWQFIRVKSQRNGNSAEVDDMPESTSDVKKIALFLIIGVIGLPIGAYLTVESASSIARSFDISEAIIGVTVVAIGTSLPELITSVMAAIRRSGGVALGNVVGSNIFNIGLILGSTALIHPLDVDPHFMNFDIPMMVFASLILVLLAVLSKPLQTWGGALMLVGYTSYVSLSF